MALKSDMFLRYTVVFTTWSRSVPAAVSTAEMFLSTRSVWAETSPSMSLLVMGSRAVCPAQKTNYPALMAWEYGPIGLGASLASTTVRAAEADDDAGVGVVLALVLSALVSFCDCAKVVRDSSSTAAKQVRVFIR